MIIVYLHIMDPTHSNIITSIILAVAVSLALVTGLTGRAAPSLAKVTAGTSLTWSGQ